MNESKNTTKSFSFLNIKDCVTRDGKQFHGITVSGLVVNPGKLEKSSSGRDYIRFSMPIQNQGPRIWSACEIAPESDDNGTVWANVTFWGRNATRFEKYLERHPRPVIVVTGSMRVEKTTAANGNVYTNTNISADDFMHVRDLPNQEGKKAEPADGNNASSSPKQDTYQDHAQFEELDGDDPLPF